MSTYNPPNIQAIKDYLLQLQEEICHALQSIEREARFVHYAWERPHGGGGGNTSVLSDGQIIEKCGVNFSHVHGEQLPPAAIHQRSELAGCPFQAMGLSIIVHPRNPYAPTSHFNLRFFTAKKSSSDPVWWFGGGFDLTPYYGFIEDCIHWHNTAKQACQPFGEDVYPLYKKWADDYFYIKHREEARGIGGIFFDDLNAWGFPTCFNFARSVGSHFLPAYLPILIQRSQHPYGQRERDFQAYRRGRYVEFNLVYDRGTLFGLQFGGRTESILISLPPEVRWRYDWRPPAQSDEARLYSDFLAPRDWVAGREN